MPQETTDYGEEWVITENLDGQSVTVTLYNQTTDSLSDTSTLSDITTEPSGSSYARQSSTVTAKDLSGNYGFDNDSTYTFDTSDSTQDVDHAAFIATVGTTDRLVAFAPLNDTRDLSNYSEIKIEIGNLTFTAD